MREISYEEKKTVVRDFYGTELLNDAADVAKELYEQLQFAIDEADDTSNGEDADVEIDIDDIVVMASGLAIVLDALDILPAVMKDFHKEKEGVMNWYFEDAVLESSDECECFKCDEKYKKEKEAEGKQSKAIPDGSIEQAMAAFRDFIKSVSISDSCDAIGEDGKKKRINFTLEVS